MKSVGAEVRTSFPTCEFPPLRREVRPWTGTESIEDREAEVYGPTQADHSPPPSGLCPEGAIAFSPGF
jgi:hypothetical protein